MFAPTDVVQPWMPRAAGDSDACLWHVSIARGARGRGCAAAGVPECFNGPLGGDRSRREVRSDLALPPLEGIVHGLAIAPQPLADRRVGVSVEIEAEDT